MFERINIYEELVKEKEKSPSLLDEVDFILQAESEKDKDILNRLIVSPNTRHQAPIVWNVSDVFTSKQIKNTCVKYRLRFLDSKLFKGEIPYEAVIKVKKIEKKHGVKFSEFKILAPSSLFKLEDRNKDPLLFAKLDNERFHLIHKWGNDMNWFRKVLFFPLSTIKTFIFSLLALSLLITLLVPVNYSFRMFIFLLSNLFFLTVFTYIGYLRFNQDFSENEWDSKFVN